ncbi:MAG TPA: hypothetical protein VGR78_14165, partial [Verrucomicrobiae bacterium]|nr:hypothetical protein [Verrucomicrobiae bacterium]
HEEGGGGDNFSATYKLDTDPDPADGTPTIMTGPVIGQNIPQIMGINGVTARFDRFAFNVADVGPSILNPSTVKLFIDGQPAALTAGVKNTNGLSPFSYVYPTPLAQGSAHSYSIQAADSTGQALTINSLYNIPFQIFPKTNLNGPNPVDKAWAVRFIWGIMDTNGAIVANADLNSALRAAASVGTPAFLGQSYDTTNQVINWAGGGIFGNNIPYPDAVTGDAAWTGDNFIGVHIGHLVVPEEADYTFGFHSDDGAAVRIIGGQAISASGSGFVDPVDPQTVLEPAPTGDSNTRGVYHLKKGVYRIEFIWYENGGGDNAELYATKGAFVNDADTSNWRLVGDPTPSETLTLLGVDTNGWTVISSDPNGATQLNSFADADAALAATGGGAKQYDVLNVGDPDTNAGVLAFPKNTSADDNDYALKATATLVVPADGKYLIGFDTDDGGRVQVVGQTFEGIVENLTGMSVLAGDSVVCDFETGDSGTTATITLKKGNYQIVAGEFERGGGSFLRVSGASVPVNNVNANQIPALAKGAAGTSFSTIQGLQLTSAATGVDNGGDKPALTIKAVTGGLSISWTPAGGKLQSTTALTGATTTWTDAGTANPSTVTISGAAKFYRVAQ